ncbi:MAG: hypothetical protein GY718_10055 [Lentisphaerae bacterium]|nr:hypothetical protein [Lentisphaerota bacterium]
MTDKMERMAALVGGHIRQIEGYYMLCYSSHNVFLGLSPWFALEALTEIYNVNMVYQNIVNRMVMEGKYDRNKRCVGAKFRDVEPKTTNGL